MQLVNIRTNRIVPLVIAGGIATSFVFKYNALDYSNPEFTITSNETANFLQNADNNYYSDLSLKSIFKKKYEQWQMNTMFCSFAEQIVEDENFKDIVSMGERSVPFICEEISKKPSTLVWALNYIYQRKISNNPDTTIELACKLWLKEIL